ncbi:DUF3108 domain-containing protein, partial [Thioclava sp. BHET1]
FAGVRQGNYYAVNGRFQSAGIVSIFRKLSYKASVTGQIVKGKPQPQTYRLTDAEGTRSHTETLSWTGDTPQPLVRVPPRKPSALTAPASQQAGTVDILTAIYDVMQKIPPDRACKARISIYDGTRRARVTLWP